MIPDEAENPMIDARAAQPQEMTCRIRPDLDNLLVKYLPALQAFVQVRAGEADGGRESSCDVVQSVCREVLANAGDYSHRGDVEFKNWLFTAATNKVIDRHRFNRRGKRDVGREVADASDHVVAATPSRELMSREALERIERAFAELPPPHREAIALSRLDGLSYAEIGRRLNRSEVAVRGLVARGMARLAELIAAG